MKNHIKYIFFDCMETIVDLNEIPSQNDYAHWTFSNSGVEHYWNDSTDFLERYILAKEQLRTSMKENEEYEIERRIELLVSNTDSIKSHNKQEVTRTLYDHYWKTYKSKCYVEDNIKNVLTLLKSRYKLAVVSNFMVRNGIEEMLDSNGILNIFDFVVTSINFGWRKPDSKIYDYSIYRSGCKPDEIIFIGDDYENDYLAPKRLGMGSMWLSKGQPKKSEDDTIINFSELKTILLG